MRRGMASTTSTNTFLQRLIGAVSLDAAIYEEVEADRGATGQALAVVLLSSLAAGIGARGLGGARPSDLLVIRVVELSARGAGGLLTVQIGRRLMPGPHPQVL